jgi:RimJ/RimL family protein N-acetyltransferase
MIETPRLILRGFRDADLDDFAAVNTDPRVYAWLGGPMDRAASDAIAARINAHIDAHGFGLWAAELKATGRVIGFIGLARVEGLPVSPCVEMGWRLTPETWGQGLASEGAKAALDWAFANLDEAEIVAFTADTNLASQAVMRKIGMIHDPARDFDHPRLAQDHPLRRHVVFAARRQTN